MQPCLCKILRCLPYFVQPCLSKLLYVQCNIYVPVCSLCIYISQSQLFREHAFHELLLLAFRIFFVEEKSGEAIQDATLVWITNTGALSGHHSMIGSESDCRSMGGKIPAWSHMFVEIDHEIFSMVIPRSADSKRDGVSYK